MRPAFLLLILSIAVSGAVAGCSCGDPCDPNTDVAHCEDNVVATCPHPGVDQILGTNRWIRQECTDARRCVAEGGQAFCALSTQPHPACDGGVSSGCEDADTELACQQGFATYRFECLRCESSDAGTNCVGGPAARCTSDGECASGNCGSAGFCLARRDAGI